MIMMKIIVIAIDIPGVNLIHSLLLEKLVRDQIFPVTMVEFTNKFPSSNFMRMFIANK